MQALNFLINYPVFRYAMVTAIAIGVVCSLLSVIVVLKRMAFIGQGISHAGFGGIGAAMFLGVAAGRTQDALVLIFCIGTAVLIGVLSRRRQIHADSAIGILLAGAMALGVILADLSVALQDHAWYVQLVGPPTYRPSFEQLLFGSLLSVTRADMWTAVILSLAVVATIAALFKEVLFFTFDEPVSRVFGVRTGLIYYLLLVLLSVTIVLSIRLVGIILASALLIVPGATATLISQRLPAVLLSALAVGLLGTVGGLTLSLELGNLSSGPCIVLVLCLLFLAAFTLRSFRCRQRA
jgi:zinc transport system permease protein